MYFDFMINVFLEKYNNYLFFILPHQVMLQRFYPGYVRGPEQKPYLSSANW
ncbi:TPA: hypothetical protein JAJ74_001321 [Legionella pneumophila]|nr:hypothetical protein [Legionella pneumophila]HAT6375831.1 hypothetical protein [Legionella pneumophila]HAT6393931.1 hypothetical protein [Legionella pneumophila]HAT6396893.1 hypothetical protein [Legionella pneumophila]